MDLPEELKLLDSHQLQHVEVAKKRFHEHFNSTKDAWLIGGLIDYFIVHGSLRVVDVILAVREPHDMHFFNKMLDSLRNAPATRLNALTLLSHVVFRRPTWLYKISQHNVLKELLKILKSETDVVILISALLILVVLLPMIPAYVASTLPEIFDIFGRIAAWSTYNASKLTDDQKSHLEMSLGYLFHRLYGMYPCNFLSYLRLQYGTRDNLRVFSHTIKPMLDTVKMHPLLVTNSKDMETTTRRWKTMEHHDVVIECEKLSVETKEEIVTSPTLSYRPRTDGELRRMMESSGFRDLRSPLAMGIPTASTPTQPMPLSDLWKPPTSPAPLSNPQGTSPPEAAIEATPETTPVKAYVASGGVVAGNQGVVRAFGWRGGPSTPPVSPLKKDFSPLRVNENEAPSIVQRQLHAIVQDRLKASTEITETKPSEGQDKKEVGVGSDVSLSQCESQICDNVLQNFHPEQAQILDLGEQEEMLYPDRNIQLSNFTFQQNVRNRLRYYSQCGADQSLRQMAVEFKSNRSLSRDSLSPPSLAVRRANSCPEIKKKRPSFTGLDQENQEKLDETVEDEADLDNHNVASIPKHTSSATQTEPVAFYPYEHLLMTLLPTYPSYAPPLTPTARSEARSPFSMLDRYVDQAADSHGSKSSNDELMRLQLRLERWRKDIHAERNRRLSGKARSFRWLEEHNTALQDQLALLEKDNDTLHLEINKNKEEQRKREKKLQESVDFWQEKCILMERQCKELEVDKQAILVALKDSQNETAANIKKLHNVESQLFLVSKELKEAEVAAMRSETLRQNNISLQKDLIVLGEAHARCKLQLAKATLTSVPSQSQEHACYMAELRNMSAQYDNSLSNVETCKTRIQDLEALLGKKEMLVAEQKRALKTTKEQCKEQLDAVETKYRAQLAINRKLESQLLEMQSKSECAAKSHRNRRTNKVSAAQDVLQLTDRGGNMGSPPLSLSLSSSEGLSLSSVCDAASVPPVRDLQSLVESHVTTTSSVSASSPEQFEERHLQP